MSYVRLETISGNVSKTATGGCIVPNGMNALCLNLKGTLIARTGVQGKPVLIPPRSLTYVRNTRLIVQCARGEHESKLLSWPTVVTNLMEKWMQDRQASRTGNTPARVIACKPIDPHFRDAVDRFQKVMSTPGDAVEPLVVSFLYEACTKLMSGMDQVQLAATPLDLLDTIKDLIAKVRQNPALPWPLKDAADMAGYSPFHFSRVFKNLVGYGFHEYVDRCRTECAVELLITTDLPVDLVAGQCGFGTTQGLRESVKEYLGLVPSELRTIPDSLDFGD
ncbi:MAG TPA: AraC family transcriptional regulator [Fimbriimonas sp.]|nr:AraC family transcriptional regulator [Fimbriimonas sp.]